jgi:hypothetical protein
MKPKTTNASLSEKDQNKIKNENDHHQKNWRQVGLRLAAIFLVIVFLAGECSVLLPGQ